MVTRPAWAPMRPVSGKVGIRGNEAHRVLAASKGEQSAGVDVTVDEMQLRGRKRCRAPLRILRRAPARVDHDVARGALGPHILDGKLGRESIRQVEPHHTGRRERLRHGDGAGKQDDARVAQEIVGAAREHMYPGACEAPRKPRVTQADETDFHPVEVTTT